MNDKKTNILFQASGFIGKYFLNNPRFVVSYMMHYLDSDYGNKVLWYSEAEVFSHIMSSKSVIRIGDGEIGLLNGGQVSYQKYEKLLADNIRLCITNYSNKTSYLLAIPSFVEYTNQDLKQTKGGLVCWLPLKVMYRQIFNKNAKYVDAHFFYYKKNVDILIEKYLFKKNLVINTTEENFKKISSGNRKLNILKYVEAVSPNPFVRFDSTKDEIQDAIDSYKGDKKDIVIILSSGPMSKALAYFFSMQSVQCIDIGLGIEQFNENFNLETTI